LLTPFQIPVGLVTGALGGAYLAWLLATGRSR
jgi:iron complex transport system permease protein